MEDFQVLIQPLLQLLTQLVGDQRVAEMLALVPAILSAVGLARLLPWVEARRRWAAPTLAGLLGMLGGLAISWPGVRQGILAGFLGALAAVGTHSGGKNLLQAARSGREDTAN